MGGGEGKAGVLGVRAWKEAPRKGVQKQRRPHLAFVPAPFAGAKVAAFARVAVLGLNTVIAPGDELPKLSIVLSPQLPDLYVCLIGFTAELLEGTPRSQGRLKRIPDTRRHFSQRQTEAVLLCHAEICRWEKGSLRSQTSHPFIGGVPGRHLWFAQACRRLWGVPIRNPQPGFPLQNTTPRRDNLFWTAEKPGRGLSAWWDPKGKGMGSNFTNLGHFKQGFGGSRGSLPPCRGSGQSP